MATVEERLERPVVAQSVSKRRLKYNYVILNFGGIPMKRFIKGESRTQSTLLPECLDDYIADTNPVRVVDVFVDELNLGHLGFDGVDPAATGRPGYHPAILLKLYIYGYLNRIQSSRRLEKESQRNVDLMWLRSSYGWVARTS